MARAKIEDLQTPPDGHYWLNDRYMNSVTGEMRDSWNLVRVTTDPNNGRRWVIYFTAGRHRLNVEHYRDKEFVPVPNIEKCRQLAEKPDTGTFIGMTTKNGLALAVGDTIGLPDGSLTTVKGQTGNLLVHSGGFIDISTPVELVHRP